MDKFTIDKNSKILILVESPNKTHKVQEIVKKLGYKNVTVAATLGHTTKIKDNQNSYYNTGIHPDKKFKIDWEIDPNKTKLVNDLKIKAKTADIILIASDPDREGESLGNHIKNLLKLTDDQYFRIKYHSITEADIKKALENPLKMDTNLCEAAETRQALDKLLGYRLSGIARTYIGAKSCGRCQSVGLKFIADREKEIQNFKPETYYDIYVNFEKNGVKFKAKYAGNDIVGNIEHLKTKEEVNLVNFKCSGHNYTIEDIKLKEKEESPKPPFCTATFQQEAASKLSLKVKDAMAIAQKLFESGHITYMRTDDTTFADDFIAILQSFIENTYGKKAWTKPRTGKKQDNAQEGHECLRVTDPSLTPDKYELLDGNNLNQKVYRLIWQRTVAAALPNAKISETQYLIDNSGEKFILVSKEITSLGYREVYSYKDEDDKDEGPVKETFIKGEVLKVIN